MRAIGYTVAWCGATALAVGVAWFGVSGVLRTALGDGEPLTPLVVAAPDLVPEEPPPAPEEPTSALVSSTPGKPTPGSTSEPTPGPTPGPAPGATPGSAARPAQEPSQGPRQKPTASSRPTATRTPSTPERPPAPQRSPAPSPSPTPEEKLHTFTLKGGRATVAVGETDCRIVSATPAEGWELKTWTEPHWLRITFLKDGKESSAFCTWNALPPRLDTYET
ncbi:hypothetical protein FDA94_07140 [Herbidospora galbida]|uniref:Secreted protein n=1 Tax=Herbidospora galbida TaxID=2575442 RepID=A0A4V5V046_9ACTN|nr:hypothetical protein [Herbidospora galbida]TKK90183.1 hypothetical protein FDA94_07140 [Herbidospora galbida]